MVMGLSVLDFMSEITLPSSTEEDAIIDSPETMPKSNELIDFNTSEFLDRGHLERRHHPTEIPARTANIRENGLKDGALDDCAVE